MKRFLSWFVHPLMLILYGGSLLSVMIWYCGPLLAIAGRVPLASSGWRWLLIAVALVLWIAAWIWRAIRRARAAQRRKEDTAPPAPPDAATVELAMQDARLRAAMAALRGSGLGGWWRGWRRRRLLRSLPCYLLLGAPGSGKSTLLAQSGLAFPLLRQPEAGATAYCEWRLSESAVLLDTAGRYTVPDRAGEADQAGWTTLLTLLKCWRGRRPLNGVLLTVSLELLLQQDEAERLRAARELRSRLNELFERLGMRLPVYVIISKCDMLAGFAEFFDTLGQDEREQVWGVSFPLDASGEPEMGHAGLADFAAEFNTLEQQLQGQLLLRLEQEQDWQRRALLYCFPQQFARVGEPLARLLAKLFEPNSFEAVPLLRGVYFTCGMQQGTPVERVMAQQAAHFELTAAALPGGGGGGGYFIGRLMRDVIFSEAGLVVHKRLSPRRQRLLAWFALGGLAVLALLLALGLKVSYDRNQAVQAESAAAATALAVQAQQLPLERGILEALPLLNAARDLPGVSYRGTNAVPWLNRMGLFQGDTLGDAATATYLRLLRSLLLPQLADTMEDTLRRGEAESQEWLYETLRVYLMLGQRRHFDAAAVQAWAELAWRNELPQATATQRQQLSAHLGALLGADADTAEALPLDTVLVTQARFMLATMPAAERVYHRVRRQLQSGRAADFSVNRALQRDASGLFAHKSGAPLSRGVDGIYSVPSYRRLQELMAPALRDFERDGWVLDRREAMVAQGGVLQAAVLQRYFDEYIRHWDAFLSDLQIVPLLNQEQAARVSAALAASDSPLRRLFQAVVRETTLDGAVQLPAGELLRGQFTAARSRLASAFGTGQRASPLAAPENPVDRHFVNLHQLVIGPAPQPIDAMLAVLKDMALYFDASDAARRGGAAAPSADVLARLKRDGGAQPVPLSGLMLQMSVAAEGMAKGGQRAALDARWQSVGAAFCRDAIAGRYPLVRDAQRDVTADDFARFFGPGGIVDDFITHELAPHVDMSGKPWRWRNDDAAATNPSSDALAQFQRGDRLRDMFFQAGGRQAALRFDLTALSADPVLTKVALDIDGQQVLYQASVPSQRSAVVLPSGKGDGRISLESTPPLRAEWRSSGPWAWFRLMDKGVLHPGVQAERYRLSFDLDGHAIQYELNASSVLNPFRRDALTQFRCPGIF